MHHLFTRKRFLMLVAPITIFFTLYSIVTVGIAFYLSVTNYRGVGAAEFAGAQNYIQLVNDRFFWMSLGNTLKTTAAQLILSLPVSFLIAYAVNRKCLRNEVYKLVFFSPYVVAPIVTGLIWLFILDPSIGLVNSVLRAAGLDFLALDWIGGKTLTPYSVALVGTWSSLGFCMAIWLMGMKNLSQEVLESSVIDGANKPQQIVHIILPMLRETFLTLFIFTLTGCMKVFDTVYVLTGGGPNHYSETIVSYMYSMTFVSRLYGYGMAIAVAEFVITICVTCLVLLLSRRKADA